MHKDPNLHKRNALVIPGGLLVLVSLVGMLYVTGLRNDAGTCEDASLVVFAGACRSALLLLAIPLVIGLALVALGAIKFRNRSICRLGHGSWAHFGLSALIALVVLPALIALLAPSLVGEDAAITNGGVDYPVRTLMAGLAVVGLVALLPFGALYTARNRANPCCQEKGCFEPCFCDEPIEPAPDQAASADLPPEPAPLPAAALPPMETAVEAPAQWEETPPTEPTGATEWEVVEDEPAPDKKAAASSRAAPPTPPLATRPTDPAAEPQDAMAIAAKWKEEDEEAARELREAGSESSARRRRMPKKVAKKAAKKKGR